MERVPVRVEIDGESVTIGSMQIMAEAVGSEVTDTTDVILTLGVRHFKGTISGPWNVFALKEEVF